MARWNAVGFFCEDIRQEMNNVDTLVGVMPDNVAIGKKVPGLIPKLGIYVRVHLEPDYEVKNITLTADFFNGKHRQILGVFKEEEIVRERDLAKKRGAKLLGFISRATLTPVPIPEHGKVFLFANVDGDEIICGGLSFVEA
ncbi:MAG: hypothetical protein R3D51_19470 [Hyphomicrobiaceae bacterium]